MTSVIASSIGSDIGRGVPPIWTIPQTPHIPSPTLLLLRASLDGRWDRGSWPFGQRVAGQRRGKRAQVPTARRISPSCQERARQLSEGHAGAKETSRAWSEVLAGEAKTALREQRQQPRAWCRSSSDVVCGRPGLVADPVAVGPQTTTEVDVLPVQEEGLVPSVQPLERLTADQDARA